MKPDARLLVLMPSNVESSCYVKLKKESLERKFTCDGLGVYHVEFQKPRFFDWNENDIVTFASSMAVEGFAMNLLPEQLSKVFAVCIGKHTLTAAKKYGMKAVTSKDTTMESMMERIILEAKKRRDCDGHDTTTKET